MNFQFSIFNFQKIPKALRLGFWGLFVVWCLGIGTFAEAATLSVTPVVVDKKAYARDTLNETLVLKNETARRLDVYAFVNNIELTEGEVAFLDPSRADFSSSLANWIEITRGVIELSPHEEKTINFKIKINMTAKPGIYHAVISFADGFLREEAEQKLTSSPRLTVNLEVTENKEERLQLHAFAPADTFFSSFPVGLRYELENIGNQTLEPAGEIRIYDRRGREVAALPVGRDAGTRIAPGERLWFANAWEGGAGFGRYKAFLDLRYGGGSGTVQDTVFFWYLPWPKLLAIFFALLIVVVAAALAIHRRYEKKHYARRAAWEYHFSKQKTSPRVVDLRHPKP